MSEWLSVFDTWKQFSPFLRRNLLSRRGLFNWAEELGYVTYKGEITDCYYLLDYLEEINLFQPIYISKADSEYGQKLDRKGRFSFFPNEPKDNDFIKFYHPFQFFQFILFWDSYRKYFNEDSLFYFYLRKKKLERVEGDFKNKKKWMKKIESEEIKWIKNKNKKSCKSFNKRVDLSEKYTRKQKREKKRENKRDFKLDNRQKKILFDQFYPKLTGSYWLNSEFLKVWIKIDSLMLFRNRIITPGIVRVEPVLNTVSRFDKTEKESVLKDYNNWRDSLMEKKNEFLSEEEKETLKNMYNEIYRLFIHSSKNIIDGLEKWGDLLEMIREKKLVELYGNLNISINIILFLKSFTRIAWELFGINILPWPKNKEKTQPYLYFKDDSEVVDFRKSVLADFGLFASTPFILYVEGGTEETLMKYYFENKWLLFPISVENIRGIDKTTQALTINRPLKDRIYFFFLDYERQKKYKEKKKEIGENGVFSFPIL